MNKKFISVIMAAILAVSSAAICASAAEVEDETAGAEVTAEASKDSGKIKFDMGSWNHDDKICFYVYDTTDGTYCNNKDGWTTNNEWGSKKLRGTAVEGEDGIVESYEIDLSGKENHNVFVIFHDSTTGMQTYDCVLKADAFGKKAYMTGNQFENPVDSEKQAIEVLFEGVDSGVCGPYKQVTSTGNIVGYCQGPADNGAKIVAKYVFDKYDTKDKSGVECCTADKVAAAIQSFNTNADDVWAEFQNFKDQDGYSNKEEGAKKLINPSSGSSDTDSNSDTDSSSNNNNNSNNNSNNKSNNSSSSNKSSTSSSGSSSSSTSTTGSTEAATETGDTTGTVAFAVVLLAAAGTIALTRKKIQD